MKNIKLNDEVIVDGTRCKVLDIVTEDGVVYYEVTPIEFSSIPRFVTIDKIEMNIMLKIRIHADNGEESVTTVYEVKEEGNESGYGSGQYISLKPKGNQPILVDCRYMQDYNLEKAATSYLKNYFGENLKDIEVIK